MASIEQRALIKVLVKQKWSNQAIHDELKNAFGDAIPSKTTINRWIQEFKFGRKALENQTQREGVVEIDYGRLIPQVKATIEKERKIPMTELAARFNVSPSTMHSIVHDKLGMKKLTPTKVPHGLTQEQKQDRFECAQANLKVINRSKKMFFDHLFTMDETWLSVYDPESRTESLEWVQDRSELSKQSTSRRNDAKAMACVYWSADGILKIFWCPQGETINAEKYRDQLTEVNGLLDPSKPKKHLFLQDNARPHKASQTTSHIKELGWHILAHPPYSPDLAPSDYFLFANLKRYLRGRRFGSLSEMKAEVEAYFANQPPAWYRKGLEEIIVRYQKFIAAEGNYFK